MMKILQYGLLIAFTSSMLLGYGDNDLPAYRNKIINVTEIPGKTKITIRLVFQNLHPIVAYAPQNFAESAHNLIHRSLLPYTTIDQNFVNDKISIQQDGEHVQVLITGKLLMQTVGVDSIIFIVQ